MEKHLSLMQTTRLERDMHINEWINFHLSCLLMGFYFDTLLLLYTSYWDSLVKMQTQIQCIVMAQSFVLTDSIVTMWTQIECKCTELLDASKVLCILIQQISVCSRNCQNECKIFFLTLHQMNATFSCLKIFSSTRHVYLFVMST